MGARTGRNSGHGVLFFLPSVPDLNGEAVIIFPAPEAPTLGPQQSHRSCSKRRLAGSV